MVIVVKLTRALIEQMLPPIDTDVSPDQQLGQHLAREALIQSMLDDEKAASVTAGDNE